MISTWQETSSFSEDNHLARKIPVSDCQERTSQETIMESVFENSGI
jgi:hypothetical protein